jgi:hypothetical protein
MHFKVIATKLEYVIYSHCSCQNDTIMKDFKHGTRKPLITTFCRITFIVTEFIDSPVLQINWRAKLQKVTGFTLRYSFYAYNVLVQATELKHNSPFRLRLLFSQKEKNFKQEVIIKYHKLNRVVYSGLFYYMILSQIS